MRIILLNLKGADGSLEPKNCPRKHFFRYHFSLGLQSFYSGKSVLEQYQVLIKTVQARYLQYSDANVTIFFSRFPTSAPRVVPQ